ncbi:MAG: methyltransferase domain-containing protein [Candidatus Bathyarchaeota archaeon]|nr:methyltransferase domain-containing protein [Candidatus Bathyarchaeota archaeon]
MIKKHKPEILNIEDSDLKNKSDQVLKALGLQPGQKIADVESGTGNLTIKFAISVGKDGQVFAVDTNPKFLEIIRDAAKEQELSNVVTLRIKRDTPNLGEKLDLVFMRNVCHQLPGRVKYFEHLKSALKTNGKIAIIEHSCGGRFTLHRLLGNCVPKEIIIKEMSEAGYQLEKDLEFLPEQSFTIFAPQKLCNYLSGMYGY